MKLPPKDSRKSEVFMLFLSSISNEFVRNKKMILEPYFSDTFQRACDIGITDQHVI